MTKEVASKDRIVKVGNLFYDSFKSGFDGNVQGTNGICQCVLAANGGVYPYRT